MYCEPCRVERSGTARFCVICGSRLHERVREEIAADLAQVRWLLAELPAWDPSSVTPRARQYVVERYRQRETILLAALDEAPTGASPVGQAIRSSLAVSPAPVPQEAPFIASEVEGQTQAAPHPATASEQHEPATPATALGGNDPGTSKPVARWPALPAALLDVEADQPTTEDRIVTVASTWSRVWKPFLNESIGWFIGAFLILSGTFYFVADAWSGMTSTTRALVVFALAGAWTLGFSAWAQFLWRREATRGAARVLRLIGAAMAPLAPLAVGPVVLDHPFLTGLPVLAWSVIASALALGVTRDLQRVSLRNVPFAMGACATMMGLAPWAAPLHDAALWLMLIPVGLLWANSRSDVRTQNTQARLFAFLSPLYLALLFGARLHFALKADALSWGTWAPFLALGLSAALELRSPLGVDGRPRWEHAAEPISILVVGAQLGLMAWAALGSAPALFVTSAIGAHTTWRLLKGSTSALAPRWIYPLYGFSCFAWQFCGQLVPGPAKQLLAEIKRGLGYQAAAEMPASYDAIYAALFVIAGAVLAVAWLSAKDTRLRLWAEPLLRCTWVTSLLVGALALVSVGDDARPALISIPLLTALCLGVGFWIDRPSFTRTGAGLTFALALTWIVWLGASASALPLAALALGLALLSVPASKEHRFDLSLAAAAMVPISVLLAWSSPGQPAQVLALAAAFAAAWLVARNLDLAWAQESAWVLIPIVVARAAVLWAPEYIGLALAATALGLGLLARSQGRLQHLEPGSALAALAAPMWQLVLQENPAAPIFLGAVLALGAAALVAGARRASTRSTAGWRDAVALCFAAAAVASGPDQFRTWRDWSPVDAVAAYGLLGLLASAWASWRGRRWRPALLAALSVCGIGFACVWAEWLGRPASPALAAALGAVGVLLTMRALLPSISVPLASLFALRASEGNPAVLLALAIGLSLLALLEEADLTWTHVLGKRQVAWAASVSALVTLGAMFLETEYRSIFTGPVAPGLWLPAVVLPLVWVRATRSGVLAIALAPLVFLGAGEKNPSAAWVVVAALIALTHLVAWVPALRDVLFGSEDSKRVQARFAPFALGGAAILGATLLIDGGTGLPWAVLMLLAAGEVLAARLAIAAAFSAATSGLAPIAATVLVALAFVERLFPRVVSRALGARSRPNTVWAAAISAVALAGFAAATAGVEEVSQSAWLFGATLVAAAVLLNLRWLLSSAVLATAIPLSLAEHSEAIEAHLPQSAWVAFAAALLASLLRERSWQEKVRGVWAKLNCPVLGDLASPLWVGAALTSGAVLLIGGHQSTVAAPLLATCALLFVTPHRHQVAIAAGLSAGVVLWVVPLPVAAAVLGGLGFILCLGGALLEKRHPVGVAWHHAGWALSLLALGFGNSLHHPATAIAWGFAAACAVVIAHRNPAVEWIRWTGLAAGAHVGLFYLGLALSTGAPRELILPWLSAVSLLLGAAALFLSQARTRQRLGSGWGLMMLGVAELLMSVVMLDGVHGREALVVSVGVAIALWALARRVLAADDASSATLAGVLIPVGFVGLRGLLLGHPPDAVEAIASLMAGAGVGALARLLFGAGLKKSARVARGFAFAWPLVGLLAAPWHAPWTICLLLIAQSAHFAIVSRDAAVRRLAALTSTAAFNGAMAAGFLASKTGSAEYLLIPFGLSLLVLLNVFEGDVAEGTRAKLRAVAVSLVYAAAAFKPLTFDAPWALWICVGLCVVGVALGIMLKIRSYVYLGTAFMVTTVIANLVRYGVREPRLGAALLSGLGLAVVGFMVLITTRRSELLTRYQKARELLQTWEG
jgi:hypothetical protein